MDASNEQPTQERRRREAPLPMPQVGDRLPPASIPSEQGVLGCILLDPKTCLGRCTEVIKTSDVFYDLRHSALYEVLLEMHDQRKLIDGIGLQQTLRDRNQLEALGGMPYIAGLMNCVPSAANLDYYLAILLEKYLGRRIIQTCTSLVARSYDGEATPQELLEQLSSEVIAISQDQEKGRGEDPKIKDLVHEVVNDLEYYQQNQGQVRGLPTGFPDLDFITGGLMPQDYIVIAARPSMGKTTLAMNIAEHVAIDMKQPVGIFSQEMSAKNLVFRMLCSRARVSGKSARDGFLADRDFPKLTGAAGKIANAPIHVCEVGGLNIRQLSARARRWYQQYGIKLLIIDYIQLMQPPAGFKENRNAALTQISNGIKALAKELNIPIIVIAQINREVEKQQRMPRASDLKDCGAIEQDADLMILLHCEAADKEVDDYGQAIDCLPVSAIIPKQRNGPTGTIHLTFLKSFTRFESASKVADVPQI